MKIRGLEHIVIVPWDFSELAHKALIRAFEMVENPNLIRVIHVSLVPSPYDVGIAWESINEEMIRNETANAFRNAIAHDHALKKFDIDFRVMFGDPGRAICEFAEQEQASLIIVPSHGRSGFSRLMLGSVAERIVRLAHCPVMVLRDLGTSEESQVERSSQKSVTVFG
jgi:nucleotide-binding universal stress UspA family protein